MNSAGTFIDILQECKRKNKKILGVRKLSRPAKECDLSIYGVLLILHLVYVFYTDTCTVHAFLFASRDKEFTLVSRLTHSALNALFVYLKVIKNGEAHKCLIKTACRSTPMSLCRVRWNPASSCR